MLGHLSSKLFYFCGVLGLENCKNQLENDAFVGCEEDIRETFYHRLTKYSVINSNTLLVEVLGSLTSHFQELLDIVVEANG